MHARRSTRTLFVSVAALVAASCTESLTAPNAAPGAAPRAPVASVSTTGIPTGRTVVVFQDTSAIPAEGSALLTALGGLVASRFDEIGVAIVTGLDVNDVAELRASSLVAAVGQDRILNWLPSVRLGGTVDAGIGVANHDDPAAARYFANGTQWSMRVIEADKAWAALKQGTPSTRVAILDTGIDYDHRELRGLVDLGASASFSGLITGAGDTEIFVPAEPQVPGDAPYMDNHFHGTHVAGTVASNNISVAGVAPHVTLVAVKVLNFMGSGSFESVATGIRYAAGIANADVINMSLGANVDPREDGVPALLQMMSRTIKWAEAQGAIVVSASGNDGIDLDIGYTVSTPCEQSTMCISATGPLLQQDFDMPATYTNFGITAIEVAAPGGNFVDGDDSAYETKDLVIGACSRRTSEAGLAVCRANTDGAVYFYAYAAGTSMATPHVAGAAALVKSYYPTLSPKGIRDRLQRTADDVHLRGRDVYTNHGRINVWRALGGK